MPKINKEILTEAAKAVLMEYSFNQETPSPSQSPGPVSDITPMPHEKKPEAKETGLQPEEGFRREGFGLTSNAFSNALKKIVKDELNKMLDKKEKEPKKNDK